MHFYINLGVCANYSQSFVSILMVKPKIWVCKHRQCHAESQTKKKFGKLKVKATTKNFWHFGNSTLNEDNTFSSILGIAH